MANRNVLILRSGFNTIATSLVGSESRYTFQLLDGETVIDHTTANETILNNNTINADTFNGTLTFDLSGQNILLTNDSGNLITNAVVRLGVYIPIGQGSQDPSDPIPETRRLYDIELNEDIDDQESFTLTGFTVTVS